MLVRLVINRWQVMSWTISSCVVAVISRGEFEGELAGEPGELKGRVPG